MKKAFDELKTISEVRAGRVRLSSLNKIELRKVSRLLLNSPLIGLTDENVSDESIRIEFKKAVSTYMDVSGKGLYGLVNIMFADATYSTLLVSAWLLHSHIGTAGNARSIHAQFPGEIAELADRIETIAKGDLKVDDIVEQKVEVSMPLFMQLFMLLAELVEASEGLKVE